MAIVITLLVAGAVLLLLETVLPGAIAGILGGLCLLGGVILAYTEFGARTGNLILLTVIVGLIGGFALWIKYFPTSRVGRVFISNSVVGEIGTERADLLNQSGTALTPLRPSGTALINGRRVDVVTEGPMIERGTAVKVVAVEGLRVVVRAV
ncbi:MAG TPA: NfeD family protein [Methylomirabilota bacterium]|nr:NfeD family protein [Methylomirabilota bacterium]